jgi:cephalosporin hydroxylase
MNHEQFQKKNEKFIRVMNEDRIFRQETSNWVNRALGHEYHYHFSWLGMPIIQFPTDIILMQELVWAVQPDLIIDVGVARGGSVIFFASMLALIGGEGQVVGVDVDIRNENLQRIQSHRMADKVCLLEGSSTNPDVIRQVERFVRDSETVLVVLDSNHTEKHVSRELQEYSKFVTGGSYIVVFDTIIESIAEEFNVGKPWGKGNNPLVAVDKFLMSNKQFQRDRTFEERALVTVAPGGFLKKKI